MSIFNDLEIKKSTIAFVHEELSEKEYLSLEEVNSKFASSKEKDSHLFYILISKEYVADYEETKEVEYRSLCSILKNGTVWNHKNYNVYVDENLKTPFLKFDIDHDFDYNEVYKKLLLNKRIWRFL